MKRTVCLVGVFAILNCVSKNLHAQSHNIFIYEIPFSTSLGKDCESSAKNLGARFSASTGHTVVANRCSTNFRYEQVIQISYLADDYLSTNSMILGLFQNLPSSDNPGEGARYGIFENRAACEAEIAKFAAIYQKKTGLVPLVSFCRKSQDDDSFVLQIDAFGKPLLRFQHLVFDFPGKVDSSLAQQAAAYVASRGNTVIYMAVHSSFAFVMYFEEVQRLDMLNVSEDLGGTDSLENCRSELLRLQKITLLALGENSVIATGCAVSNSAIVAPQPTTTYFPVLLVRERPPNYPYAVAKGPSYSTYDECDLDRDRVVALFARAEQFPTIGTTCTYFFDVSRTTEFTMTLYARAHD